jgi:hypothetical protein
LTCEDLLTNYGLDADNDDVGCEGWVAIGLTHRTWYAHPLSHVISVYSGQAGWTGRSGMENETDKHEGKRLALRLAGRAAEQFAKAQTERRNALRLAQQHGASLREIAAATGIPFMTVKRIIERPEP